MPACDCSSHTAYSRKKLTADSDCSERPSCSPDTQVPSSSLLRETASKADSLRDSHHHGFQPQQELTVIEDRFGEKLIESSGKGPLQRGNPTVCGKHYRWDFSRAWQGPATLQGRHTIGF